MVLRVQWLQLLGPIMVDYQRLTMDFDWENRHIHLQGERQLSQQVSMNQLRKLQHQGVISSMFHIAVVSTNDPSDCPDQQHAIQNLLLEYTDVFEEPKTFPPHRQLDHEIHLLPNATLVNVRPYRYPHF